MSASDVVDVAETALKQAKFGIQHAEVVDNTASEPHIAWHELD